MASMARSTWVVALCGLAARLGPACGGDGFSAAEPTAAGQPGGGQPPSAGDGGTGEPTSAGNGGASAGGDDSRGGAPADRCASSDDCEKGRFCRDGTCTSCADLTDLSALAFGPAEPFELINESATDEALRFARRLPDGAGLVYVRDFFGGTLWVSRDAEASAGAAITKTDVFENGPLALALALPEPLTGFDFFFSRRLRVGVEPLLTRLFGAKLGDDGTAAEATELPAPFNTDGVVASYGLALSATRAIWSRNQDGKLGVQLVTSPLPPDGEPTPLRLPLPDGCGFATELDYGPWLSPDGKLLLFSARRVDEGCNPPTDAISHLYALELSAAGQPVGEAHTLHGMLEPDVRQTDASLSPDGCELIFSAQDDGPMRLYRAARVR